MCRTLTS